MEKKNSGFWFGLFLGGLIGAALIIFTGTKEGRKLAKKLRRKIEDYLETIEGEVEDKKDELVEKAGEFKDEALKKATKVGEQVIEKAQSTVKTISSNKKIEEVQEKGREIAEQIGKNLFSKQGKTQG